MQKSKTILEIASIPANPTATATTTTTTTTAISITSISIPSLATLAVAGTLDSLHLRDPKNPSSVPRFSHLWI